MKVKVLLVCLTLCISFLSGCANGSPSEEVEDKKTEVQIVTEETKNEATEQPTEEVKKDSLPFEMPMEFLFSSGAGGWGTVMTLNPDGTFTGVYSDSDMGDIGENYPNGVEYICEFRGYFEKIKKIDEYSYSMEIGKIFTKNEEGEEWIEDGILYLASAPYGLDGGEQFHFYVPGKPIDELSEDFLSWWFEYRYSYEEEKPNALTVYGIHNINTGDGFFTYE